MSQYNKTVLTNAGLELAKRANAGQAKFEITRAVTSADDWSNKTVQDLEEVTTIPNIMQQGIIMDTDEVESNNSVIGVSLCFTNKNLSTGYQIRIIGLYVKEEGQENDFLYAVTTAITPEYMPDFNDKVLYRFNMQMYLVIGNAQSVNVVINEGTAVTHGQLDKYKAEVTGNLKKLENTHKEDMSHVAKSASINGGDEILPDSTGKLNLIVPDPDLSEYVSLEQLTEILQAKADVADVNKQIKAVTDLANTKANSADVYTKTEVDSKTSGTIITAYDIASKTPTKVTDSYTSKWLVDQSALFTFAEQINQLKGRQTVNSPDFNTLTDTGVYYITRPQSGQNTPPTFCYGTLAVFNGNGSRITQIYAGDDGASTFMRTCGAGDSTTWSSWNQIAWKSDITNLQNAVNSKADTSTVNAQIADVKDTAKSNLDKAKNDLNDAINAKANASDVYTKTEVDSKTSGTIITDYDIASKTPTKVTDSYTSKWLVDQSALFTFAEQINQLKGRRQVDAQDFNNLTDTGTYYVSNPGANMPTGSWGNLLVSNGAGHKTSQMYFPDDGSALYMRELDETTWHDWIQLATTSQVNYAKSTANWDNINGRPQDQINRINVDGPLFKHLTQFNNWGDLFDGYSVNGINATNGSRLVAFRDDTNGSNTVGSNGAGIGFGGSDTKGVLSVAYGSHQARITGGNGTGPTWSEDIAWKSDVNDLRNQVQQLKDNQFEVQTFTDATAAANWEAQKLGKRMAIVNS